MNTKLKFGMVADHLLSALTGDVTFVLSDQVNETLNHIPNTSF